MRSLRALLIPVILAVAAYRLPAQSFGEITGSVTDPSGAAASGTTIRVTNSATNQVRQVQANEAGNYTVPFLAPGSYEVRAEKEGFRGVTRGGLTLRIGDVARIDFTLEVGAVTQTVEVQGGVPLLDTASTAVGTVIENKRIVELPLNGRNYLQLIALSPNVSAEQRAGGFQTARQGGDRTQQSFSVGGMRLEWNRYTLDGIENTDVNFNTFVIRPSIEALQEFKIQTGVYSAEFGRATSQINVITKSGSNEFHGSLFEFLRNDKLDAKEWRKLGDKNPFRRNQFGYTFGGRIVRDKLFFLSNMEMTRDRQAFERVANVAPDRMRTGDFSGQSLVVFDPNTRVLVPDPRGNQVAESATPFPGVTGRDKYRFHSQVVLPVPDWRHGQSGISAKQEFGAPFGRSSRSSAQGLRSRASPTKSCPAAPTEADSPCVISHIVGQGNYHDQFRFVAGQRSRRITPGNMVPTSRLNPIARKLLEFYPEATRKGDDIFRNYIRNASRPIDQNQYTQRIDWNESTASTWFGRYSWGDELFGQAPLFPTQAGRTDTKVRQAVLANTRTFGSTVVNEFRFGWGNFQNEEVSFFAGKRNVIGELGIQGLNSGISEAWGDPVIAAGGAEGLNGFGSNENGPFVNRNHVFQWLDNVSITRGRHSFKFGGEVRRDRYNQFGNTHIRPVLGFGGATIDPANRTARTGHSFADLMIGEVSAGLRALGIANLQFRATSLAFYAEDTWRVTPKLTLNLGLRYENTPPVS